MTLSTGWMVYLELASRSRKRLFTMDAVVR